MLTQLHIHGLRNIDTMYLKLHPSFNCFYGQNGSGKTSVLEALYLLGSGYSFRTREIAPLVQQGKSSLTVFAKTTHQDTISVQKSLDGVTLVRLNQQPCQRSSDLARFLPCLVFYHDLFQIIDAGPSVRRGILDWGMFHMEHSYHGIWKEYRTVLKQRNALLRQKAKPAYFVPWDNRLVELAYELDRLRAAYCKDWAECFQLCLQPLSDLNCVIRYDKGWDKKNTGKSLKTILTEQFEQDLQRQYTQAGAHQADLQFDVMQLKAKQHLSRGQQKIILLALKLAQARLLNKQCLYLMDDITVELDAPHIERLFETLSEYSGQFFLTSVQSILLSHYQHNKSYHLEQGHVNICHA
ncbi:MAG TPA: DNA replication/repair protein RecF [Legionellaceae bacterium]|nr:DNA replication/repair protein RecF [Legionellaceae bacterium]